MEAAAVGVDLEKKTVSCHYTKPFIGCQYDTRTFEVPYDVLVVGVSPQSCSCLTVDVYGCN